MCSSGEGEYLNWMGKEVRVMNMHWYGVSGAYGMRGDAKSFSNLVMELWHIINLV